MSLAKAVANAAAMLVLKAKNVAQVAEDTVLQNRVIAAATQCALSTSQLVACAKVSRLAPRPSLRSVTCSYLPPVIGGKQGQNLLKWFETKCFRCLFLGDVIGFLHKLLHSASITCSLFKAPGRGTSCV